MTACGSCLRRGGRLARDRVRNAARRVETRKVVGSAQNPNPGPLPRAGGGASRENVEARWVKPRRVLRVPPPDGREGTGGRARCASFARWKPTSAPSVLTIGTFDGVRRRHERLIGAVVEQAQERGVRDWVGISLRSAPARRPCAESTPPRITTVDDEAALIATLSVDTAHYLSLLARDGGYVRARRWRWSRAPCVPSRLDRRRFHLRPGHEGILISSARFAASSATP